MEITFTDPIYLWFLFSIPLLIITHFITLKFTQFKALKFANFRAIERVTGKKVVTKNYTLLTFRLFILFFLIFSISLYFTCTFSPVPTFCSMISFSSSSFTT